LATEELKAHLEENPPNLRVASDYNKEPHAPRCFNCAYLRDENLQFSCSKFMVRVKVYEVCDEWDASSEEYSNLVAARIIEAPKSVEQKTNQIKSPLVISAKTKAAT
jgi:hypothetical protein